MVSDEERSGESPGVSVTAHCRGCFTSRGAAWCSRSEACSLQRCTNSPFTLNRALHPVWSLSALDQREWVAGKARARLTVRNSSPGHPFPPCWCRGGCGVQSAHPWPGFCDSSCVKAMQPMCHPAAARRRRLATQCD